MCTNYDSMMSSESVWVADDEQTVSYEHFLETNAQHSSDPTANTPAHTCWSAGLARNGALDSNTLNK